MALPLFLPELPLRQIASYLDEKRDLAYLASTCKKLSSINCTSIWAECLCNKYGKATVLASSEVYADQHRHHSNNNNEKKEEKYSSSTAQLVAELVSRGANLHVSRKLKTRHHRPASSEKSSHSVTLSAATLSNSNTDKNTFPSTFNNTTNILNSKPNNVSWSENPDDLDTILASHFRNNHLDEEHDEDDDDLYTSPTPTTKTTTTTATTPKTTSVVNIPEFPLFWALVHHQPQLASLILEHGGDLHTDVDLFLPLTARCGHLDGICQILAESSCPQNPVRVHLDNSESIGNVVTPDDQQVYSQALAIASSTGHVKVVETLLEKLALPRDAINFSLGCACRRGHLDVVKFLVERAGADVRYGGDFAINVASTAGVVEYLLERGANGEYR
ncbi:hypothetical protein HK102_006226, partial [Quaeritorhiza haematococci]